MSFKVDLEIPANVRKLLDSNNVEKVLLNAQETLGKELIEKIQTKGYAPRDTGKLAESHQIRKSGQQILITSNRPANNNKPLWNIIVEGHRVLNTPKSRRWWFWYLNNALGGHYTRKTNGPPGYVPPNKYHKRTIQNYNTQKIIKQIQKDLI